MPAKKKQRTETPKQLPIWQIFLGTHYANLDTETTNALEKAREDKNPNPTINIMNIPHNFDLTKMEMVDTTNPGATMTIRRVQRGVWEYPDDQDTYVALYDEDNDLIEAAWRAQTLNPTNTPFQTKDLSWNKGYDTLYTYTFSDAAVFPPTAEQKNEDSGRVRKFRRLDPDSTQIVWDVKNFGIANMQLPTIITPDAAPAPAATADEDGSSAAQPDASAAAPAPAPNTVKVVTEDMLKVPDTWEPQTANFQRFPIAKGCAEYDSIIDPFLKRLKNNKAEVVSLERLQNSMLWKFYALTRYRVAMRNSGNPNEKYLYHGARVRENMDAIMNFGFDMRVARNGLAGVGIYFAVHSSYSNCGYVLYDPATKTKEMFVCRVTVGSCTKGKSGMVRPPPKSKKKADQGDLYDSVHNNEDVMYIVFDNTQAYPEYLIKYKENNGNGW